MPWIAETVNHVAEGSTSDDHVELRCLVDGRRIATLPVPKLSSSGGYSELLSWVTLCPLCGGELKISKESDASRQE